MESQKKWEHVIKGLFNRYLIDGLGGMALGLFSTLLIGTIIKQIGFFMPGLWIGQLFITLGQIATVLTGIGIGVGVAHNLGSSKLVLYSSVINGLIGAYALKIINGSLITDGGVVLSGAGDPLGAFLATVIGVEFGRFVSGKTKLDILITPAVTIVAGSIAGMVIGPPISKMMNLLGTFIQVATAFQPFLMGIIVAVTMGMFLTLPISSAAISMILGLSGIAAGAATAGCTAQMIGFAVMSYKENKINGLLAQGLGTSMLQMPNIIKNPRVWIPPILTSAITGPLATIVFKMENVPAGAGMGTSGLVGPILTWQTMSQASGNHMMLFGKIIVLYFILPAILTLLFASIMRKKKWIEEGDLKLNI